MKPAGAASPIRQTVNTKMAIEQLPNNNKDCGYGELSIHWKQCTQRHSQPIPSDTFVCL
jgi:hypothetical protein